MLIRLEERIWSESCDAQTGACWLNMSDLSPVLSGTNMEINAVDASTFIERVNTTRLAPP